LLYYESEQRHFGSLLEAGAALADLGIFGLRRGVAVLPRVKSFPGLALAIAALR
jgi:hypothetical protein